MRMLPSYSPCALGVSHPTCSLFSLFFFRSFTTWSERRSTFWPACCCCFFPDRASHFWRDRIPEEHLGGNILERRRQGRPGKTVSEKSLPDKLNVWGSAVHPWLCLRIPSLILSVHRLVRCYSDRFSKKPVRSEKEGRNAHTDIQHNIFCYGTAHAHRTPISLGGAR